MGRPKKLSYHVGVLHGINLTARMSDIAYYSILQKIQDEEQYKEIGYGDWKDFCREEVGISYETLNKRFAALKDLGPELTKNFAHLGLKWKDVRLLEQSLTEDQKESLKNKKILSVEGKDIPFDDDHKSDIQSAIDILKEKASLAQKSEKIAEKKIEGIDKEHKKEIKALTDEITVLQSQIPSGAEDSAWAEKYIEDINKAFSNVDIVIRTFAFHKKALADPVLQSKIVGLHSQIEKRFKQFVSDFDAFIAEENE